MSDPFAICAATIDNRRCSQTRRDHLHTPPDGCANGYRHHDFRPDVAAIAADLRLISPLLAKSEAYELIRAVTGAPDPLAEPPR